MDDVALESRARRSPSIVTKKIQILVLVFLVFSPAVPLCKTVVLTVDLHGKQRFLLSFVPGAQHGQDAAVIIGMDDSGGKVGTE